MIAFADREFSSVTEVLASDHARLDGLFGDLAAMLNDGEIERADYHFLDLQDGLERHIRTEEEILFPVFDARTRLGGPTNVMRTDHRRIEALLGALRTALEATQVHRARETLASLNAALADHNRKEEYILYPKTDAVLAPEERSALAVRIASALRTGAAPPSP
jgi:iron-sulfur cluster repair protein YtfE (RIC family)